LFSDPRVDPPLPAALVSRRKRKIGGSDQSKKKRRFAEANRHLPVNSKSLIDLPTIGFHDRQQ
jgi:hypothetical protein